MKRKWNEYLWIVSVIYLVLGFINILFAWLGLICFFIPLVVSLSKGNKAYCNTYCGRGQMLEILGRKYEFSQQLLSPKYLRKKVFRYGFLIFFLIMFLLMLWNTYLVYSGAPLKQTITLLWSIKLPWEWTNTSMVDPAIAQFAFGFYSIMLTSTVLGVVTMIIFKPRSWCVYCPMGTMTQLISTLKNKEKEST
ncbi:MULTISPECIES: 4Fe-4S binding protein [unclassified Breznakia]|uniref:4Fe-4S binding protein n=1 Tax=unclassified Breznakia TaxID=2623764 RepID=UPI0024753EF4|nr:MULTISPECIES: 4Fe-4S binding protein [unclassified Breznakia]MDH6368024.1 polyferredoxin [Breznakia sp. PH1-1]MDH6405090.1 polyferredoxin [Breznakia sp. PF1-11]MDH6412827.1 polyferredoxin [Breznakia sp. PFB1-11]MDH6415187.1 polyferredoxin [Breznakia sp. PFB1-14]MDH6417498.1 polyferredoxin [Breznakia sp. PFB1-4]